MNVRHPERRELAPSVIKRILQPALRALVLFFISGGIHGVWAETSQDAPVLPPDIVQTSAATASASAVVAGNAQSEIGVIDLNPAQLAVNLPRIRHDAQRGNASTQYQMGLIYAWGIGVFRNVREAARWYEKAADAGNPWAQVALGALLVEGYTDETGRAQEPDPVRAYLLFTQASRQGIAQGTANLALLYLKGIPEKQVQAQPDVARALLWRLSDDGYPGAPVLLAWTDIRDIGKTGLPAVTDSQYAARVRSLAFAWSVAKGFEGLPEAGSARVLESAAVMDAMKKTGLWSDAILQQLQQSGAELAQAFMAQPASFKAAARRMGLSDTPFDGKSRKEEQEALPFASSRPALP